MVGIGGTSFLARNSKNRIHVVVTHVGSLGRNVFRAQGNRKALLAHYYRDCQIEKGNNASNRLSY